MRLESKTLMHKVQVYRSLLKRRRLEFNVDIDAATDAYTDHAGLHAAFHARKNCGEKTRDISYTASWSCQKTEPHTHGGRYTKKHNAQYEDVKKSLRLIYANLLVV